MKIGHPSCPESLDPFFSIYSLQYPSKVLYSTVRRYSMILYGHKYKYIRTIIINSYL